MRAMLSNQLVTMYSADELTSDKTDLTLPIGNIQDLGYRQHEADLIKGKICTECKLEAPT